MAYSLTPAERRARAQALKETRENRFAYQKYIRDKEEWEKTQKVAEQKRLDEESRINSQNFFVRAFSTIGDIAANVITGAVKGLEGIYDLGAGIVGAVGGIFDDGFQDRVKEHIAYDWTMETFGNDWQEALKYSYTKDGGIIEGVASGIGQMLPAVAVTIATGGAGAPAAVAQAASLATMGVSAAGNATEEAYKDGASYWEGLGYGVASGAVEAATEKIFGGATKGVFGKGMADDLVKKSVASTGIKRVAKNALEEGIEEVAAELVNPALKSIYKGGEAFNEYGKGEYWLGVGKAGAIGSLTALAYSGSVGYGLSKVGKGYVGAEADINESLMEIDTQKKKAENLFANDKLTEKNDTQISSNVQENYRNIERTLQKANDKKRASLIEKFSLGSAFESNGTMKVDFATKLGLVENVEQVDTQGQENSSTRLASLLKKEYYSPSLRGNEAEIETDLTKMTEQLRADEIKLAQEEGRQAREVGEIKPFTGELTEKGKQNYSKTKKAVNYLNNKSGKSINLVVVESNDFINADIVDDRTIYIGADTFENDTWAGAIIHEYTHFAEGTKEYVKLVDYLQKDVKLFSDAFNSFVKRGYASGEMINSINEKIAKGEALTEQEQTYKDNLINSRTFRSEMGAIMSEQLLGSETFIDNIVSQESSIAEKVMKKIKDLKGMFERLGNAEARAEYKRLAKAEKLYLKAIEKAGYKYRNGKILARRDSDEIDSTSQNEYNNSEIQSSRKFSFQHQNFPGEKESGGSEAHRLAIWWASKDSTMSGDQTLISMNGAWYLVEKFDDADNGYQVEDIITKKEYDTIYEEIKENGKSGKILSIQRAFTDYDKFYKLNNSIEGRKSSVDSIQTQHGGEDTELLRVDTKKSSRGQTESNGRGNSESGGQSKQVKFSLKPSEYQKAVENIDSFESIDAIKDYFGEVMSEINHEPYYPKTMADVSKHESERIQKVIEATNIEKEAIKEWRKKHSPRKKVSLETKAQIEEVDRQYQQAIQNNDLETAKYLVEQMAILKGYSVTDYRIDHRAPYKDGYSASLDDVSSVYGEDIYGKNAVRYFGTFEGFDSESVGYIQQSKGKPNGTIIVYRAVPISVKSNQIRNGDWITLTYQYAKNHGESNIIGNYRVIKKKVRIGDVYTNGDSIHEFGYDDGKQYYYRDTENYRKLADTITFDDEGNPIRLKDRFNYRKSDIRFSLKENVEKEVLDYYGKTYKWSETVYLFKDGTRLDGSGRVEGARGGYRTVDHRDIFDILTDSDTEGSEAMVEFMSRGNIRVMPETPGINLQVEPTEAQYKAIQDFVERVGFNEEYFSVDFDNLNGDVIDNLEYEGRVSGRKVVADIKHYFKEGSLPYRSELSKFRYSRKENGQYYYQLSKGQIKKMFADNTGYKVYSKVDAEQIINNVLSNYMSFGDKYGEISGKTKKQVIDMLWQGLNSAKPGNQTSVALNIADYIIQNSVLESVYGDMYEAEMQVSLDIVEALRPYLHKIDLSSLKGEISHKYDTDNSPYLLWGKRKGENGMSADQIAMELESQGIHIDAINEADIFFEIDSQYRNAIKHLKTKAKDILSESLSKQELHDLRQDIAKEVLRGFDYTGDSSKLAKIVDKYKKQIATLNAKLKDSKAHNRAENRVLDRVQKIKDIKLGTFLNATQFKNNIFKGSIERLSLIKNRGNLNESGTRRILAGLYEWYDKSNPILSYVDDKNTGLYNEEIASILQAISQNQKPLTTEQSDLIASLQEKSGISDYKGLVEWYTKENLGKSYNADIKSLLRELASETTFTTEELVGLEKVVGYFANLIENHNKVYRKGKYVEALPIVEEYLATMEKNKGVKVGWLSKIFDKVFNNTKWSYLETFSDPITVARKMDMYESGFYTEMLESFRRGAIDSAVMEMSIREELDSFLSKHKKFLKESSKKVVEYRGNQMPLYEAMLLYMTLNREQALGGLAYSGFTYENSKGESVRVKGFTTEADLTLVELVELAKAEQETLYKQFSEVEKEYISIAERIFNEQCKEAKRKTDMVRMGYSNVLEGYYIPIKRAYMTKNIDQHIYNDEINRASNPSFNKDTVKGAKGELFIEGLDSVLDRHIRAISQYANLSTVIDEYNVLYNLNTSGNPNNTTSIRTQGENVWKKGDDYFRELIGDIQGVPKQKGIGSRAIGFIRSGYAKYQLGANPKVWATQFSSLFAASSILDYSSIIKGLAIKTPDVDEYCNLAKLRNNDDSAAKAQGVLDKVDSVGDFLMKPIGLTDRFVVKKLFGACQIQVEKDNGLKVGTVENKTKAGELLERVILETQQNSLATERSAAMRNGNEIARTITMFTADSMKVVGRVIDSLGEVSVLKAKIKQETDPQIKKSLEEKLKKANKKARKSITALGATAIFMALVAQGFRWLYNKDDEDDNIPLNMTVDAIGNLMGGLPLIKDIYSKLVEGYDLDNYAYSALNDLLDSFKAVLGDEGKPAQQVKNIINAIGQIFGIPTRNVYNFLYGITNRISPSTGYLIDNAFYNQNYSSDLAKAIENEDEDMIATIVGIMLNERVGSIQDSKTQKELNSLVVKGYEVLPKSIGKTITYNGEEITLTSKQKEQFKKVYSKANETLASLVEGKYYESATDEVRAKAIKFIYDIYYNLAIEDLLGVDLETKNILFAKAVDIPSLAIIVATARALESDKDNDGKTISGSKKAKVQSYINSLKLNATQKYMIMGYLGYTNKYGALQVKRYIQSLSLTTSQKELLYEYSGYKN